VPKVVEALGVFSSEGLRAWRMWLDSRAAVIDLESHDNEGERRLLLNKGDARKGLSLATVLLSVAVAIVAKGTVMHGISQSGHQWTALKSLQNPSFALSPGSVPRSTALAAEPPNEDELKKQIGRVWVRRRDAAVQQSSSAGGPGMPLAASFAKNPEELKHNQFHKV
jgi:hypothetical protein